MPTSSGALPTPYPLQEETFQLTDLRVFTSVPQYHHDVVALLGMVVVYDTHALGREVVEDGGLYVVEDQRPVGGMSWETYDRLNSDRGQLTPSSQIKTTRRVVRLQHSHNMPECWDHVLPSGARDGPIPHWDVTFNMVGKVVGIYRPNC